MVGFSTSTWWLVLGIVILFSVISIISFTAQCLGCCQRRDISPNAPALWDIRQFAPPIAVPQQGPASMQMAGIQVVQVQPRRAPRKPKIQPLTAHMIERLPSFFLDTTAKEDALEERECAICQEEMAQTKVLSLPCGHIFHKDCIREWLGRKATCPTCRLLLNDSVLGGQAGGDVEQGLPVREGDENLPPENVSGSRLRAEAIGGPSSQQR